MRFAIYQNPVPFASKLRHFYLQTTLLLIQNHVTFISKLRYFYIPIFP